MENSCIQICHWGHFCVCVPKYNQKRHLQRFFDWRKQSFYMCNNEPPTRLKSENLQTIPTPERDIIISFITTTDHKERPASRAGDVLLFLAHGLEVILHRPARTHNTQHVQHKPPHSRSHSQQQSNSSTMPEVTTSE